LAIIRCANSDREKPVQSLPLDPDVADLAPTGPTLTAYDEEHVVTYVRMLDADREGADWREVSRIVLHIDPSRSPIERGVPSTAISHEPNGRRGRDTGNCFEMAPCAFSNARGVYLSAIVALFVLWREIGPSALWDLCKTICQQETHEPQQTTASIQSRVAASLR
jgi:hypothetical protein